MSDGTAAASDPDDESVLEEHDDRPRLVQFTIADRRYLAPVDVVQEVLVVATPPTRLPGAVPAIVGVTSIRGRIVAVVDPRPVLDPTAERGSSEQLLVIATADGPVALVVDRVDAVVPAVVEAHDRDPEDRSAVTMGHALVDDISYDVIDLPAVVAAAADVAGAAVASSGPEPGAPR